MRGERCKAALLGLALGAWLPAALAQDAKEPGKNDPGKKDAAVTDEKARAALAEWLTKGALAPFEGKARESVLEGLERDDGRLGFVKRGSLMARLDERTGRVTSFLRMKPLLWVETRGKDGKERPAADRAAEVAKRAKLSLEDDVKRARTFLEAHHPAFGERVFEVESKERLDRGGLVQDEIELVERPRKGVVACWPNRLSVSLDPETGAIVEYEGRDVRIESTDEPRLSKEEARKKVLETVGSKIKPENRAFLEKEAKVELVAMPGKDGAPGTTWLVAGRFAVDAKTGELAVLGPLPGKGE